MYFFFNDTATTEIYTLSLHDALPIFDRHVADQQVRDDRGRHRVRQVRDELDVLRPVALAQLGQTVENQRVERSEEHTSELQSRQYLVCRLLLEKKKINVSTKLNPFTT